MYVYVYSALIAYIITQYNIPIYNSFLLLCPTKYILIIVFGICL